MWLRWSKDLCGWGVRERIYSLQLGSSQDNVEELALGQVRENLFSSLSRLLRTSSPSSEILTTSLAQLTKTQQDDVEVETR